MALRTSRLFRFSFHRLEASRRFASKHQFLTKVFVANNSQKPDANEFVFYQLSQAPVPGLNTDALVWRKVPLQGQGGLGSFEVPFETSFDVFLQEPDSSDVTLYTKRQPASNGESLMVTKGYDGAPMLKQGPNGPPGSAGQNLVTLHHNYPSEHGAVVPTLTATAYKNNKPLIMQKIPHYDENAQFEIWPIIFMAWRTNLQEGQTFKTGTYADKSVALNLLNTSTHNPGAVAQVDVHDGPGGQLRVSYTIDGSPPGPLPTSED